VITPINTITWYVARRDDGYFSAGEGWTHELRRARFHVTVGPVKSAVTKYVKANPGKPIPEILEWKLDIASATVLDVAAETNTRIKRAALTKLAREEQERQRKLRYLDEEERRIAARREELSR